MSAPIVFVDTETTGLDPSRHEVWDIGLILGDTGEAIEWHLWPDLSRADSNSLRLTDFYGRTATWTWDDPAHVAKRFATLTSGKHLVGAVPSFDAAFLAPFLRAHGQAPAWHYHLVDVEALVAGYLRIEPPWDSDELAEAIGVPRLDGKHTAIGDARWAKAVYDAVVLRHRDDDPAAEQVDPT